MNDTPTPVSPSLAEKLNQTQPWLRFIAIMTFIGAGMMVLAGLGMLAFGTVSSRLPADSTTPGAPNAAMMAGLGIFYLILALIYVFPALHLLRSARAIRDLAADGSEASAALALEHQRRFWKFAGIGLIVILVLYVVAIVAAIAIPAFAALQAAAQHAK